MNEQPESTWFDARWAEYAARRPALPGSAEDLRRLALEFFSWGCVHQAAAAQRLELAAMAEKASGAAGGEDRNVEEEGPWNGARPKR